MTKKQVTIYIDTRRCMNCRSCEIACKLENNLPAGPRYTMVTETEFTKDGVDKCEFLPVPCMHCGDAPCMHACPTGAISKRVKDGVVVVNQTKCIGCRECLWSCLFGVPQFGSNGLMSKCSLCAHRLDDGMKPACAQACPAEAISVGTVEEISATIRERYATSSRKKIAINQQ